MNENPSLNGQQPTNGQQALTEKQAVINETQRQYQAFEQNCIYGEEVVNAMPKESVVFSRPEKLFAFAAAGLSFLFVHFVLWNTSGFFTTLFYMLLFIAVSLFLSKTGHFFKPSHKVWLAVLLIFSAAFSVTANELIKCLDVVFLILGGAYLVYCFTTGAQMEDLPRMNF